MRIAAIILTAVLALMIAACTPVAFVKEDETSAAYLSKLAKTTEKELHVPMMVDKDTRLVSIEGLDHELRSNYLLVNYSSQDLDSKEFIDIMKPSLQELVCNEKGFKPILDQGVVISYIYTGTDHKIVGKISITKDMCK